MLEIIAIVAIVLATAVAAVLSQHQGAGGKDLSVDQRFSSVEKLVPL